MTPVGTPHSGVLPSRVLSAGALAAAATVGTDRLLTRWPPAWPGWSRSNFRGRPVSLAGGASAATAVTVVVALVAPPGLRRATVLTAAGAALAGAYDDLVAPRIETAGDKGWRGHVLGLRAGRPTGGVVKVAAIGASAVTAARLITPRWSQAVPAAALVAGTANLVNLFDLRPGRAGKVVLALAGTQLGGPLGPVAAAVTGAAAAELPGDLGETRMLGDVGANALGAVIGLRLAANGPVARWTALALIAGLTAASERISFTQVIASRAPLRRVDEWGRRPANQPLDGPRATHGVSGR